MARATSGVARIGFHKRATQQKRATLEKKHLLRYQRSTPTATIATETSIEYVPFHTRKNEHFRLQRRRCFISYISCPSSNRETAPFFVKQAVRSSCTSVKQPMERIGQCTSHSVKRMCNVSQGTCRKVISPFRQHG